MIYSGWVQIMPRGVKNIFIVRQVMQKRVKKIQRQKASKENSSSSTRPTFRFSRYLNSEFYSSGRKSWIFCYAPLFLQILVNYQNQGQFWNLLVLRIPKLSLKVKFDKDLAEIIKVKDNKSILKKCLILNFVFDLH